MQRPIQLLFNGFVLLSIACLFILHFKQSSNKLVYVNSTELLNGYQGMIDARKEYQKKAAGWQANVDTLTQEVKEAIEEYEKGMVTMTTKEKQLSERLLHTKQRQLVEYQQAIREKARQEDEALTKTVLTQANTVLEKYGKDNHYHIILAANQTGNIAYAEQGLDITEVVLEVMNNEYGKKR